MSEAVLGVRRWRRPVESRRRLRLLPPGRVDLASPALQRDKDKTQSATKLAGSIRVEQYMVESTTKQVWLKQPRVVSYEEIVL